MRHNTYLLFICDGVQCEIADNILYRNGIRIGRFITTVSVLPLKKLKLKNARIVKPNKGPLSKQKWLQ